MVVAAVSVGASWLAGLRVGPANAGEDDAPEGFTYHHPTEPWHLADPDDWTDVPPAEGTIGRDAWGRVASLWTCISFDNLEDYQDNVYDPITQGAGVENIYTACGGLSRFPMGPPAGVQAAPGQVWACTPGMNVLIYSVPFNRGDCGFKGADSIGDAFGTFIPTDEQIAEADKDFSNLLSASNQITPEAEDRYDEKSMCAQAGVTAELCDPGSTIEGTTLHRPGKPDCETTGGTAEEQAVSLGWDVVPPFGIIKGVHDSITGKEAFTGRCLSDTDRALAGAAAIASVIALGGLIKGANAVRNGNKLAQLEGRMSPSQLNRLKDLAAHHGADIYVRPPSGNAGALIEEGIGVGKPECIKAKSLTDAVARANGLRPEDVGKVWLGEGQSLSDAAIRQGYRVDGEGFVRLGNQYVVSDTDLVHVGGALDTLRSVTDLGRAQGLFEHGAEVVYHGRDALAQTHIADGVHFLKITPTGPNGVVDPDTMVSIMQHWLGAR